jgi:hypothetical protein
VCLGSRVYYRWEAATNSQDALRLRARAASLAHAADSLRWLARYAPLAAACSAGGSGARRVGAPPCNWRRDARLPAAAACLHRALHQPHPRGVGRLSHGAAARQHAGADGRQPDSQPRAGSDRRRLLADTNSPRHPLSILPAVVLLHLLAQGILYLAAPIVEPRAFWQASLGSMVYNMGLAIPVYWLARRVLPPASEDDTLLWNK